MVKQIDQWLPLYISGKDIQTKPHHVCDWCEYLPHPNVMISM